MIFPSEQTFDSEHHSPVDMVATVRNTNVAAMRDKVTILHVGCRESFDDVEDPRKLRKLMLLMLNALNDLSILNYFNWNGKRNVVRYLKNLFPEVLALLLSQWPANSMQWPTF